MSGTRQAWLVARREVRERTRTGGFWAGLVIMLVVVVAAIAVPAALESDAVTRDVGLTGEVPEALPDALVDNGEAVDVTVRLHRFDGLVDGEEAVRDEDVDVLVVDARRLEWRGSADDQLRAVVTGAIQLVAVQERAASAGIDPAELAEVVAPVPVENVELAGIGGRSPDDEAAAYLTSVVLLIALASYGNLVLTGVVQEKSSRVVEVLLARMPARNLLAGKIAGIGLLGFAQFVVTAVAALVATLVVDTLDVPAISGGVLAWVVAWFVLGYVLYAVAYGAVGSLVSRTEDASSVAAPVTTLLLVAYWGSLLTVGPDPESGAAQVASIFPLTAPFAMPGRIALGATAWWEPVAAVGLTLAAIFGLVVLAGRVYSGAILRTGATLKLREAWRDTAASGAPAGVAGRRGRDSRAVGVLVAGALGLGVVVAAVAGDVILGVGVAAIAYTVGSRVVRPGAGPAR